MFHKMKYILSFFFFGYISNGKIQFASFIYFNQTDMQ